MIKFSRFDSITFLEKGQSFGNARLHAALQALEKKSAAGLGTSTSPFTYDLPLNQNRRSSNDIGMKNYPKIGAVYVFQKRSLE